MGQAPICQYRDGLVSTTDRPFEAALNRGNPDTLISHYTQAPSPTKWLQSWEHRILLLNYDVNLAGEAWPSSSVLRAGLRAHGLKFVDWERPAHDKIPDGFRVLVSETLVAQTGLQ